MELTTSLDIFVTTLSLAGIPLPNDRAFDGGDLTPLLRGDAGAVAPRDWFFYYTTCTERAGCPDTNITIGLPSDRIAAVRDAHGGPSITTAPLTPVKHRTVLTHVHLSQFFSNSQLLATTGPMKAHFFTHSAQGVEPFVRHDPPLVFNVERSDLWAQIIHFWPNTQHSHFHPTGMKMPMLHCAHVCRDVDFPSSSCGSS